MRKGGLGIRTCRRMNSSFMAKMGWCLLHEEEVLWVSILKGKYFSHSSRFHAFAPKEVLLSGEVLVCLYFEKVVIRWCVMVCPHHSGTMIG